MMRSLHLSVWLVLFILCLGRSTLWSQETDLIRLKVNYQDKPLSLVLLDLNIKYGLQFDYEEEDIEAITVTANLSRMSLAEGMNQLLANSGLGFRLKPGRKVSLFRNSATPHQTAETESSQEKPTRFDVKVSGVVKDETTGERLPFASVIVRGTLVGTATNVDGYFTLFDVPADTSLLEVQYLGYQTRYFRLTPGSDLGLLEIGMDNYQQQLQEVVVMAEQEEQLIRASKGISQIGVSPVQLATLPSFGEKDIFRGLQLLPGVSGTNESSSGLYVRGGTPDQNLILFDGFTVYHVDHLFGFFSAFNSNAIKDVQLHKGGFDAKFGGRISSVVELTGKDGNTESFNAGVGISLLSYNGFVEAPFAEGKGSFLVAGRRSFQSSFYSNLFDSFTEGNQDQNAQNNPQRQVGRLFGQQEVQPNSYFYDLNAKVTYRPSSKDVVAVSFYNGEDNLDNSRNFDNSSFGGGFGGFGGGNANFSFQSINTDLTNWGNWGGSTKWSRRWSDRFYSNANLSYSNYFSERDRNNAVDITRSDTSFTRNTGSFEFNDLKDFTLKLDNELKINKKNQLEFGWQSTYNNIEYAFTQNDTISVLDRKDEGWTHAVYIQDRQSIADKLILKGGIRATRYSVNDKTYLEPRASLTYLVGNTVKLKAAYGRYYQFATRIVREDIQQGSRDFWLLANDENVPVSSATHYILGASYETNGLLFDVEGYYKDLDGLSEYSTRFVPSGFGPNRTLDYEEFFYNGTGIARGLEFLLQKKTGRFTGWIGYTLGQVKYDFEAFGEEPFFANQDQTHELKIVGSYKWRNWTFSSTFIYGTGRPYTAPTGYYEIGLLDGTSADFFEISDKNALRFPDYHRFDLAASLDFRLGGSKANAGLSLFNIYNRKNVWYKEYEVIEGELIETDVNLLDFTPSLFLSWKLK